MVVENMYHNPMINHQNKKNDYVEFVVDNDEEIDLMVPKICLQGDNRKRIKESIKQNQEEAIR